MFRHHGSSSFTIVAASAFALACWPSSSWAQDPCLEALPTLAPGAVVRAFATSDLDGDGDRDVVTAHTGGAGPGISVHLNSGGTFAASLVHSVNANVNAISVADFDNDGDLDIAFANGSADAITLLLNQGGTFGGAASYAAGDEPYRLAVGDLDGDADLDMATVNLHAHTVTVIFNQGSGTFGATATYSAGPASQFAPAIGLGDLDGDGDLDLVTTSANAGFSGSDSYIVVRKNLGAGAFGAATATFDNDNSWAITLWDFDSDGDLDLAVADDYSHFTKVYMNPGNGIFSTPPASYSTGLTNAIDTADLDLDRDRDIVVGNYESGIRLLFNNGVGSFTVSPTSFPTAVGKQIEVGDLSGDLRPEVLRLTYLGGGVQVFRNCQTAGGFRYCFGDGSADVDSFPVACPCGNYGVGERGCANLLYDVGAQLTATGTSSVSADSLVLKSSEMSGAQSWYFQATGQDAIPFGRGILCVSGALLRVGQKSVVGGASTNPSGADLPLSVKGAIPPSGGTRYYQVSYRQANPVCTPAPTSNTNRTNGLAIVWTP